MRKILPILLIIGCVACARTPVDGTIEARADLSYTERLVAYAGDFVGTPYALDPLGEGVGFDANPLYDFNKFDCVTYVETVIALANADNFDAFVKKKKCVSYVDCDADYTARKHFFEIDHDTELADITDTLGVKTKTISGTIDRAAWLRKKDKSLVSSAPAQRVTLSYIARDDVQTINIDTLPAIAVVGIVMNNPTRRDTIGSDVLLSHTGFLVKKGNKVEIWHAGSKAGKVVKQDFVEYMASANRPGFKVWGIK